MRTTKHHPSSSPRPTHSSTSASTTLPFTFPPTHHLTITTPRAVLTWDAPTGLNKIFSSRRASICAAKESTDGTHILAVADTHTVILHDCKRGRERSWGLHGDGDAYNPSAEQTNGATVRLLEYAPDAKSLYLSTTLDGRIQTYSIHEERMLGPALADAQAHASPPTVMAVSPAGHLMVSASRDPPMVFLTNMTHGGQAQRIRAGTEGEGAVVAAAFHADRGDVFLLAFADGTVAAFDATKMKTSGRKTGTEDHVKGWEIGRLRALHRVTNVGGKALYADAAGLGGYDEGTGTSSVGARSVSVTAAAFLPGYRTRAVTVGADGRVRLVDFEGGGTVLRTWHAKGPITSLAVLRSDGQTARLRRLDGTGEERHRKRADSKGKSAEIVVAVGRADGKVLLFDSVGLKLDEIVVSRRGEKVIGLEWIKGPSPRAVTTDTDGAMSSATDCRRVGDTAEDEQTPRVRPADSFMSPTMLEEDYGTVQINPRAAGCTFSPTGPASFAVNYLDLFSPVKQPAPGPQPSPKHAAKTSPQRQSRPRVSSKTFKRNEESDFNPSSPSVRPIISPKQPALFPISPGTASDSSTPRPFPRSTPKAARRVSVRSSTAKKRVRRPSYKPAPLPSSLESSATMDGHGQTHGQTPSQIHAGRNGQILADLRRIDAQANAAKGRKQSAQPLFTPYMRGANTARMGSMAGEAGPSHQQQGFSYHRHSSHADDVGPRVEQAAEEDIWLTSESEGENAAQQRQRRRQLQIRASRAPVGHAVGEDEQEQMVHTAQEPSLADRMRFSISSATNEPPPQLVSRTSMPLPAHLTAGFSSSSSATSTSDFESASLGPASDVARHEHEPVRFKHPAFDAPKLPSGDYGEGVGTGMTEEDEELYTAREQLSPRFEPSGRDINVLFPRTSSSRDTLPSPTGEGATSGKGKEKARASARASQGALGGLAANTVDGRERRDTDARRHYQQGHHQQQDKGKERRRSRPAEVEVYEDYDDAAAGRRGSRIGSRGMTTGHGDSEAECGTCVETGREVKELRHEVARLKVEMIAMKAALRQAGVRFAV